MFETRRDPAPPYLWGRDARWPTAVAFAEAIQRAAGTTSAETVPIFDPATREAWLHSGPQPIADALAHLTAATTTVEADAALHELVAITCRWLAVIALAGLSHATLTDPKVRERARAIVGRDDGGPWLELAKAAMLLLLAVAGPILIASLITGVAIGLLQALTQVQEMTLTFVPKLLVMGVVLLMCLPMMGRALAGFMAEISARIVSG